VIGKYYTTIFPQVEISPFTAYRKAGVRYRQFIRGTIYLYAFDGSGWPLYKSWTSGRWVNPGRRIDFVGEPAGPVEGYPGLTFNVPYSTRISATIKVQWYDWRRRRFGTRYIHFLSTSDYQCVASFCDVGFIGGRAYVRVT
jgi:hypothetical protein